MSTLRASVTAIDGTDKAAGEMEERVDQLLPLVTEAGMDSFVLWTSESPDRQLELFAAEVAPALREAVAAHRGRG